MSDNGVKKVFVSFSSKDGFAGKVVDVLERQGARCFYAPRDIREGRSYPQEIIAAIDACDLFVLVLTQHANDSHQVVREVNAAVSRGKRIIPLKFGSVNLGNDMEYYLGVCQWIEMTEAQLDDAKGPMANLIGGGVATVARTEIRFKGIQAVTVEDLLLTFTPRQIAMREIELDYLMTADCGIEMSDEQEGSLEDWSRGIETVEYETSVALVQDDLIIGYYDMFPLCQPDYDNLVAGKGIIRDGMIDVAGFGGTFPVYVALMVISPEHEGLANYFRLFDALFEHLARWKARSICVSEIAVSVYSAMQEKFWQKLGFVSDTVNPIGGKIYRANYAELIKSAAVRARYGHLDL